MRLVEVLDGHGHLRRHGSRITSRTSLLDSPHLNSHIDELLPHNWRPAR